MLGKKKEKWTRIPHQPCLIRHDHHVHCGHGGVRARHVATAPASRRKPWRPSRSVRPLALETGDAPGGSAGRDPDAVTLSINVAAPRLLCVQCRMGAGNGDVLRVRASAYGELVERVWPRQDVTRRRSLTSCGRALSRRQHCPAGLESPRPPLPCAPPAARMPMEAVDP